MSGESVLIVEDNGSLRTTLGDSLASLGYEVLEAGTVEEAFAQAIRRRPDLVLLDLDLPDVDGLSVARKLREKPETAAIVVAALTGEEISGARAKEVFKYCIGYIPKPVGLDRLARNVALFLRIGRAGAKFARVAPVDTDHPKRRHPRFHVEIGVLCRFRSGRKPTPEGRVVGLVRTLSEGGFQLELPYACDKGVVLEISLRTDEGRQHLAGEVVWIGPLETVKGVGRVYRHGLRFVRISRQQQNAIRRFLIKRFTV